MIKSESIYGLIYSCLMIIQLLLLLKYFTLLTQVKEFGANSKQYFTKVNPILITFVTISKFLFAVGLKNVQIHPKKVRVALI